mmetsp:Transcript_54518/g.145580  ORF Transcript_54518/g.145580 Transcript_54518/m.145580 type:complete len:222 (+) Transcript_54518:31-696(+)
MDPRAFPEHSKRVPLNPKVDETLGINAYEFGFAAIPKAQSHGAPVYNEELDAKFHQAKVQPAPYDARAFHAHTPEEDRINTTYDNMVGDELNVNGAARPKFQAAWQKDLAYHHGLYVPELYQEAQTADNIRIAVSEFQDKVHQDDPKDACKYLLVEEFKCLHTQQVELDVHGANKKCVKWFDEFRKCQWDQHKFNAGHTYIEGPQMRRRTGWVFMPKYQYA